MTEPDRGKDRAGRRANRFLAPSEKYKIGLQLVRQEVTIVEAAEQHRVDRSTIMRIRTVSRQGASAALAACKPGVAAQQQNYEMEATKAEIALLSEADKQMAVKLTLVEEKGGWT